MMFFLLFMFVALQYASSFRVVCYYSNWAQYRTGKGHFVAENISSSLCTHIIFAHAENNGIGLKAVEWNDDHGNPSMYRRVQNLKRENPALKVLLAYGDNSAGISTYTTIVRTAPARMGFAQAVLAYIKQNNFDGIDLSWNYPGTLGRTLIDKWQYAQLFQEIMEVFQDESLVTGKTRYLLTATVGQIKENIDKSYDAVNIAKWTDFITILSFDFHGYWEGKVGFNSPLFGHPTDKDYQMYLNMDWVAQYYLDMNINKEKINLGLAFYGRSFTLSDPNMHDIGSPAKGPGKAAHYTRESGITSYYEVCDMVKDGGQIVNVPEQHNRYVVQDDQWVGYDDIQSITEKACYVREYGLGGVSIRSLDMDDFNGLSCNQGEYPLLHAVNDVFAFHGGRLCSPFVPFKTFNEATNLASISISRMLLFLSLVMLWQKIYFSDQ